MASYNNNSINFKYIKEDWKKPKPILLKTLYNPTELNMKEELSAEGGNDLYNNSKKNVVRVANNKQDKATLS